MNFPHLRKFFENRVFNPNGKEAEMSKQSRNQNYRRYKALNPQPKKPVDEIGIFINKGDRHFLGKHLNDKSGAGKLHPIAVVGEKGTTVTFVPITHESRGKPNRSIDRKSAGSAYVGKSVLTDSDDRVMFVPKYAAYTMKPINKILNKRIKDYRRKKRK